MAAWVAAKWGWARIKAAVARYVANDDPLTAASNAGAFLVWSSQPLYPFYVWLLVGHGAWPALLTWFSTPFFASAPLVARKSAILGRAWFVATGVLNTLLSLVAFGPDAGIAWFLVPCLIIAAGFFRASEWPVAAGLSALVLIAALAIGHLGGGLVTYTSEQSRSLSHLNAWSAAVLSAYLVYSAFRAHRVSRTAAAA